MSLTFYRTIKISLVVGFLAVFTISCQPQTRKLDLNTSKNPKNSETSRKISEELDFKKTCQVSMPLPLSKELVDSTQTIETEITNMDLEHIDCKGNIVWKGHGAEKNLRQMIEIPTSIIEASAHVNFIQIENIQTCTTQRILPADDVVFDAKEITLENGTKEPILVHKTMANSKGNLKLVISDSKFMTDASALNALDGQNLIKIQYFGKCLKYRKTIEDKTEEKTNDALDCETAESLGNKEILIDLKISRPEGSGTHQVILCSKAG